MLGFGGEGSNATPKGHGERPPARCPNFMAERAPSTERPAAGSLEASGASCGLGAGARRRSGSRQGQEPEPKQERDPDIVGLFPPPAFIKRSHSSFARRLVTVRRRARYAAGGGGGGFGGFGDGGFGGWGGGMRATHGGVRPDHPTPTRRDGREADARLRISCPAIERCKVTAAR